MTTYNELIKATNHIDRYLAERTHCHCIEFLISDLKISCVCVCVGGCVCIRVCMHRLVGKTIYYIIYVYIYIPLTFEHYTVEIPD